MLPENAFDAADFDQALRKAALKWWRGRRPLAFTAREHVRNATINLANKADLPLARLAAKLEKKIIDFHAS